MSTRRAPAGMAQPVRRGGAPAAAPFVFTGEASQMLGVCFETAQRYHDQFELGPRSDTGRRLFVREQVAAFQAGQVVRRKRASGSRRRMAA